METKVKVGIAAVVGFVVIAWGADTFGGEEPPVVYPPVTSGTTSYPLPQQPGTGQVQFGEGFYPDSEDKDGNKVINPGSGPSYRQKDGKVIGPNENYPASN